MDLNEDVSVANCAACHKPHIVSLTVHFAPVMYEMVTRISEMNPPGSPGQAAKPPPPPEQTVLNYRYLCPEKKEICNLRVTVAPVPGNLATPGKVTHVK